MNHSPDRDQHRQHERNDEVDEQVDGQLDEQLDEQLLPRLHHADPAADLPPLREDLLAALLQAATSTPRASDAASSRPHTPAATTNATQGAAPRSALVSALDDTRRRRRRWSGAAALGLAAAAAGVIALSAGLPGLPGASGGPGRDPQVTALRVPAPSGGLPEAVCAPIEAATLADDDLAFEGTVIDVRPVTGGEVVVLDVVRVFAGGVGQRVEVDTPGAGSAVDGTVQLVQGRDYLIAAVDGTVSGCGATGPVSPELQALYEQAFGGGS